MPSVRTLSGSLTTGQVGKEKTHHEDQNEQTDPEQKARQKGQEKGEKEKIAGEAVG